MLKLFKCLMGLYILLLLVILAGCDIPGTSEGVLIHDGRIRSYRLRMPPRDTRIDKMPLVIVLHGGYHANIMADMCQLDPIADREGFLAVYPNGILGWWNVDDHVEDIDDVGYISSLIDHMHELYDIDLDRVYVTGSSNGGFMVYKLAIELSDRIRAVATAMSSMPITFSEIYDSVNPIPIMHIQGDEDPIVLMNGGFYELPFSLETEAMPIRDMLDFWIEGNKANPEPEITQMPDLDPNDGTTIVREYYTSDTDGAPIIFYLVKGGGHGWPGSTWPDSVLPGSSLILTEILGKTSNDMVASEVIWDFFDSFK